MLECIDDRIAEYASFVFWYEVFLPYSIAKESLRDLYENYLKGKVNNAVLKRYSKLPFFIFYWIEHLRYIKNRRISK